MGELAREISPDDAFKVFEDWKERQPTIAVVIGFNDAWGLRKDGIVVNLLTSPGQTRGIEFWSLSEGLGRKLAFDGAVFFSLNVSAEVPESLRIGWSSFLLVRFEDGRRLFFAERRED